MCNMRHGSVKKFLNIDNMPPQNGKIENNSDTLPSVMSSGGFTAQDLPISDKRPRSGDTESIFSDYRLKWLFDPTRRDHLPIEEQLQYYKQRDLRKVKVYKIAASLWGAPESRKRRIIAPRMEKVENKINVNVNLANSELRPQNPPVKGTTPEEIATAEAEERKQKYKSWMEERKKFRSDLENMGLTKQWLARKPDKTALEQRVLKRMFGENKIKAPESPPEQEEDVQPVVVEDSPIVKRPSPIAVGILEQFLREKRMRLIDLFSAGDKDKSWTLSRKDFKDAMLKANIPLSDVLLEDLVLALDHDMNDELDYRELARGMGLWKKERREARKKLSMSQKGFFRTKEEIAQLRTYDSPLETYRSLASASTGRRTAESDKSCRNEFGYESLPGTARREETNSRHGRIKSAVSNMSSGSSQYLEPPDPDLRPEQKILSSEEAMVDLRKRDKVALVRNMEKKNQKVKGAKDKKTKKRQTSFAAENSFVKTGDAIIDGHCAPSTLGGETGDIVDKFRQLKLKEYHEIIKICKHNNIPLNEELLKKVLLNPPDKPHSQLTKKIRQPRQPLLSETFAEPPKRPRTPIQERLKDRIKVTKSGQLVMDSRHRYPNSFKCEARSSRMNLSTGKAFVRRQVDCWMTFEEYNALTKHLAIRYSQLHGQTDYNAFWPGHLLDKICLCMPEREPLSSSVFSQVRPTKKAFPL